MGGGGAPKSYKRLWRPLSLSLRLLSIVGFGEGGRGGIAGRQNPRKDNGAPSLCHYKIVKYCGVGGGGGTLIRGQNPTQIMAPPLPVIKIVKYCDVWGGGGALGGAKILQKIMVSFLSVSKIVKYVASGEGRGVGHGGAPKSHKR